jgi:hypothetical protein
MIRVEAHAATSIGLAAAGQSSLRLRWSAMTPVMNGIGFGHRIRTAPVMPMRRHGTAELEAPR